jgi:hypothetical protein
MRFALIAAFVSSVFFTTERAEARPDGDSIVEARKPQKVQRRTARPVAKKATKKVAAKKKDVADEEVPAPKAEVAKAEPPAIKRAPVAQATDDEVPRNEPKQKR